MRIVFAVILVCLVQAGPPPPKGVKLERLAAIDAREALHAEAVVIIPLGGGIEPHPSHLSVGTDLLLAEHIAHRVTEATPAVLAPAVPYFFTATSAEQPAASLSLDTAREAITEAVRTLARSGPRRFYIVNMSVPAGQALSAAATTLASDGILLRFTDGASHVGAHGKETETSMLLHIDSPSVSMDRAPGDASGAAAARGKVFLDSVIARIVREVDALRSSIPPAPQPPPTARTPMPPAPPQEPHRASGCTAGDERTIVDLAMRMTAYWALRNVDRLAELWSQDGDLVHPDGAVERGRDVIRTNRREQFNRKEYGSSKHNIRFGVIRCLTSDVAVVDGKWDLSSVYDGAGNLLPRGSGPMTVVLEKHGETWLFEAYRYSVTLDQQGPKPPTLLKKPGYPDK